MKEASIVEIERKAIALIDRFRKDAGLSEAKLGELAFPEAKNYRQKINSLRNARGNGNEPLRLRLGDFCAIVCHALGKNPAQELLLLWGRPIKRKVKLKCILFFQSYRVAAFFCIIF